MNTNIEQNHYQLIKLIKKDFNIENSKNPNGNNKIFEFCLIYYFNVILRVSRRDNKTTNLNYFDIFKDIINLYIENDVNKAKYILEEFSNSEAIKEYLVYCPSSESVNDCLQIIMNSFETVYNNSTPSDTFCYEFMDSLIIFIDKNIRQYNLENINALLMQMINGIGEKFINYLKKKSFGKWLRTFYGNVQMKDLIKNFVNESLYPTLKSNHSILVDTLYNKEKKQLNEEYDTSDQCDQQFSQKLNNLESNIKLLRYFEQYFEH
jgi:hypothetical protein